MARVYECKDCGKECDSPGQLGGHRKKYHPKDGRGVPPPSPQSAQNDHPEDDGDVESFENPELGLMQCCITEFERFSEIVDRDGRARVARYLADLYRSGPVNQNRPIP